MDYQEIRSKAASLAKTAKRTSVRLCKTAKISLQITKKESSIEDKYIEIGKIIYNAHSGNDTDESKLNTLCREIDVLNSEIADLKDQKTVVGAGKKCDVCGCGVHPEERNCPNCGCEL